MLALMRSTCDGDLTKPLSPATALFNIKIRESTQLQKRSYTAVKDRIQHGQQSPLELEQKEKPPASRYKRILDHTLRKQHITGR